MKIGGPFVSDCMKGPPKKRPYTCHICRIFALITPVNMDSSVLNVLDSIATNRQSAGILFPTVTTTKSPGTKSDRSILDCCPSRMTTADLASYSFKRCLCKEEERGYQHIFVFQM